MVGVCSNEARIGNAMSDDPEETISDEARIGNARQIDLGDNSTMPGDIPTSAADCCMGSRNINNDNNDNNKDNDFNNAKENDNENSYNNDKNTRDAHFETLYNRMSTNAFAAQLEEASVDDSLRYLSLMSCLSRC